MKIHRIDHVSINVNDLAAAKALFVDLRLEVHVEGNGRRVGRSRNWAY
jgi:catechol 2,3-dioxygenase-like lactoylglutathione lyase family enzyme